MLLRRGPGRAAPPKFDMHENQFRLVDNSMTLSEHASEAASANGVHGHRKAVSSNGDASSAQSVAHFLRTVFRLFSESEIRYCVLHSWNLLPEKLYSDLDLAVHPLDKVKLPGVFEALKQAGYAPIQWGNYVTNGHGIYFIWERDSSIETATLDIIFEHRRAGMILASGEALVCGRIRRGEFWIAAPEVEYSYLLAKKAAKAKASPSQSLRLKQLVECLGRERAEELAGRIFQRDLKARVVEACAKGSIDKEFGRLKLNLGQVPLARQLSRRVRYWASELRRAIWRTINPTGVLLAILGPDGAGKSTLIEALPDALGAGLRRRRVFHWRPEAFARRRNKRPVTDPHGQVPRGAVLSIACLSAFFIDYWIGYIFVIRPLLVASAIVQFDRYFHDVLVDPLRYRYGGPRWFAAILSRLVPEPDLVILLDADEHLIRARKAELSLPEIKRQRQAYRGLRFQRARQGYVRTDSGIEATRVASVAAVTDFMKERFNKRIGAWMRVI